MALKESDILYVQRHGMPEAKTLGTCECGCGDFVSAAYQYCIEDGKYFVDEIHYVKYAKENYGLEVIG